MKVTLQCQSCKSDFLVHRYRATIAKYCSKSCATRVQMTARHLEPGFSAKIASLASAARSAKKIHRYCMDCGAGIGLSSTRCRSCSIREGWRDEPSKIKRLAKMLVMSHDAAHRLHMSQVTSDKWNDDTYREAHSGPNSVNWKGGTRGETSRRIRTRKWIKFALKIRLERGEVCQYCGLYGKIAHHVIPVRVNPEGLYDESNIKIACPKCHGHLDNPKSVKK